MLAIVAIELIGQWQDKVNGRLKWFSKEKSLRAFADENN